MDKLQPCPFCGGLGEVKNVDAYSVDLYVWLPVCTDEDCIASALDWHFTSKQEAIKRWNRRDP